MPSPSRIPDIAPVVNKAGMITQQWAQWFDSIRTVLAPPPMNSSRAFYIPKTSGAPTFTPEVRGGFSPMAFDPSTGILYIHDGSNWLSTTLT